MKTIFGLILCLGISFMSYSQKNTELAVLEKLRVAMLSGDTKELAPLTHAKLTYGHSSGLIENQEEFLEAFKSGNSKFTSLDFSEISTVSTKNICIIRHILEANTHNLGKDPAHIKLKVMLVFEKVKNQYLLIARQAIKL